MLYPINIKIKEKGKIQVISEGIKDLKIKFKKNIKYLILDRTNLGKMILIKLHI